MWGEATFLKARGPGDVEGSGGCGFPVRCDLGVLPEGGVQGWNFPALLPLRPRKEGQAERVGDPIDRNGYDLHHLQEVRPEQGHRCNEGTSKGGGGVGRGLLSARAPKLPGRGRVSLCEDIVP